MTKSQLKKQRVLKRDMYKTLFINAFICLILITIMLPASVVTEEIEVKTQESQAVNQVVFYESKVNNFVYSDENWNQNDDYLLAKIAMAEAEGCDINTKCLVIMTVLNRLKSDEFPNTIEEIIYQRRGSVYQFSPIGDGRWDRVEPNEECWLALEIVMTTEYDFSKGALYFESCKNKDNWHSRNLEFLYKSDIMRFYK